jgi:glycerophosphoryl diester phosphodiesterase
MKKFAVLALLVLLAVYFLNASWLAAAPETPAVTLIAHRGVHHTFDRTDLGSDTCTALHIHPPEHDLFENTIPSMQAAFAAGAEIVELDVHPTTDGQFAVMHDWTIDCRTEGKGETRSQTLDLGYGYSSDGGATFPLRGKGEGLMPSLTDVLNAMPERRFLINFKSNEEREAVMLAELAEREPEWRASLWGAYGGDAPTLAVQKRLPELKTWTRRGLVACLGRYVALGWSGYVPEACRDTMVMLPINVAPWLWGWPNRFQQRLAAVGSEIILLGPYSAGDPGTAGIDDLETLDRVPASFDGYVWTNRIEIIGPALGSR